MGSSRLRRDRGPCPGEPSCLPALGDRGNWGDWGDWRDGGGPRASRLSPAVAMNTALRSVLAGGFY